MLIKSLATILIAAATLTAVGQEADETKDLPIWISDYEGITEPPKKTGPDSLYVLYTQSDGCPGSSYEDEVDGELVRARIKPASSLYGAFNRLFLYVYVSCLEEQDRPLNYLYKYDVYFAELASDNDIISSRGLRLFEPLIPGYFLRLYPAPSYGSFGQTGNKRSAESAIRESLRDGVSKALTDYLKANLEK
ncbi:MAG: hypothetical protein OXG98_00270 [Gemmatimonadetes bacterium]|nr:hypothetical protein [Gemmatimonadota bacterium]